MNPSLGLLGFFLILLSCQSETNQPFSEVSDKSGISFTNELEYTEAFNPYTYRNFYNGAGVALGDINNDGLLDIYFTGNMVDNKLFLNNGNWEFKDITTSAGVACSDVWSSGATFADVNGDGFLDLYVCKSGKPEGSNRHNELFINNGDNTFREESKNYGLDITGLSTHAAFFDYDKDGDLDVYILTNSIRSIGLGFDLVKDQRKIPDPDNAGNKLLRNDGTKFTDITTEAGIYSSNIGFGLGITLGDFNNDNWTDIFISNDFFERDYLYLNNQQGGFSEVAESYFGSMSMGSMGADVGDLDNDGDSDLMVTEMLPATQERQRHKTMFETWDKYQLGIEKGYHHQFSRNALHINLGTRFSEVSRLAGVSATEWSWGALISDLDNDGLTDIFVSNGIYKDLLDRDYLAFMANDEQVRQMLKKDNAVIKELIDIMPSGPVPNTVFKNDGHLNFTEVANEWGLGTPSFSSGSAYGDLDNDGDLDLVVNNVGMPSFVYRNNLDTTLGRSIRLSLKGSRNTFGVGAVVKAWKDGVPFTAYNYPSRGFQSSVDPVLHIGVGNHALIDSLVVQWPENSKSVLKNVKTNKHYSIHEDDGYFNTNLKKEQLEFLKLTEQAGFSFVHKENSYVDFDRERLLFQMYSNEGPALAVDVSLKGTGMVYLGGAKNRSGVLYDINKDGLKDFISIDSDVIYEDTHALFFDCDSDGDNDLLVTSGGRAFSRQSDAWVDRLYLNDNGVFTKSADFPNSKFSSSTAVEADIDNDGDIDLFVGERFDLASYGIGGGGHLFENDGMGGFREYTQEVAPGLDTIGMVTDAAWMDFEKDGDQDLILVGDWMGIKILLNENGKLVDYSDRLGLSNTRGWWMDLEIADLNSDGKPDFVVGNHGLNSFFKAGTRMYVSDFDKNGSVEHLICHLKDSKYYPIVDRDELVAQLPMLKKKVFYYKDYAVVTMSDLFTQDQLNEAKIFDTDILETSAFINNGSGFNRLALPLEAQFSSIYAIKATDVDDDGWVDLVLGGNQHLVKPQFGRFDALPGFYLKGTENGFTSEHSQFLNVDGQVRGIEVFNHENKKWILFAINEGASKLYEIKK